MGSRSPFKNHGRLDSSKSGELCLWWYDRCPSFMLRFSSFQILALFYYLLILIRTLDESLLHLRICLRRGRKPSMSREKRKERRGSRLPRKGSELLGGKQAAGKRERRLGAVLPTPLSMEGHPSRS